MAQLVGAGVAIGYTTYFIGLRYDIRSLTKSLLSAAVCGSVAWLISGLTAPSLLSMILTVALGVTIYVLALIWLCDRPTQEAVAWIRSQANQYLSFFSR